ncbi:MAG: hypothetical protein RIT14_1316, partial [Pseudomonadota bacterium]
SDSDSQNGKAACQRLTSRTSIVLGPAIFTPPFADQD